uniref:Integrase catalytic domain-containing protein n=1 Tax=Magnetococcus massalia (strain MO-1) TaxID=451514 RepID=A0A1S7LM71_MAGMO|nr:Protein of unknown function [Candidatus Magnetococcus massalia]
MGQHGEHNRASCHAQHSPCHNPRRITGPCSTTGDQGEAEVLCSRARWVAVGLATFQHMSDTGYPDHRERYAAYLIPTLEHPNVAWGSDISYVWAMEGWLYLAAVMDLYTRGVLRCGVTAKSTATYCHIARRLTIMKPGSYWVVRTKTATRR